MIDVIKTLFKSFDKFQMQKLTKKDKHNFYQSIVIENNENDLLFSFFVLFVSFVVKMF